MYKFIYQTLAICFLFTSIASADLIAYYSMNGSDGITEDTAIDTSGQGNDGTIHGAVAVTGRIGQALSFDDVNDYVNCGNNESLQIADEITVETWFKTYDNTINFQMIITKDGAVYDDNLLLYLMGSDQKLRWRLKVDTNQVDVISDIALENNTWYHIAALYNGSQRILYVNGADVGSDSVTGSLNLTYNDLLIGRRYDGYGVNGAVDEVRIYNEALSPAQVLINYQKGRNILMTPSSAGKIKMTPSASGKLKMGEE